MSSIMKSPDELRAMAATSSELPRYTANEHLRKSRRGLWLIALLVAVAGVIGAVYGSTERWPALPPGQRDASRQEVEAASKRFDAAFKTLPPSDLLNYEPATENCVLKLRETQKITCAPDSINANLYLKRFSADPLATGDELQKLFTSAGWLQKDYVVTYQGSDYELVEREDITKPANPVESLRLQFKHVVAPEPPVCAEFSFYQNQSRWSGRLGNCR